jgi:hypothetical protein
VAEVTAPSPNNPAVCCLRVLAMPVPRLLPLAGRGGEERKGWALARFRVGGGGGVASLASGRVAERWPLLVLFSTGVCPACRGGEGTTAVVRC